jgi:hypothetical protein
MLNVWSGIPKITSALITKPGRRIECTCEPANVAPRARGDRSSDRSARSAPDRQGEVAAGQHGPILPAGNDVDIDEVVIGATRRADHDMSALLERRENVVLRAVGLRVLDEHIALDHECFSGRRVDQAIDLRVAEDLAEFAPGMRARDGCDEGEILLSDNGARELRACPARCTRETNPNRHRDGVGGVLKPNAVS